MRHKPDHQDACDLIGLAVIIAVVCILLQL
jgi:hypothetical protein